MYRTSDAYKEERRKHHQNDSYVYVFLGLINREAQGCASIDTELTEYSDSEILDTSKFEAYYATAEENFATADTYFLPTDPIYYGVYNQGAVVKDLLSPITFRFEHTIGMFGGLTIDFGDVYPTSFTATNGNQTYTYENNKSGMFFARGNFFDSDYLTITPLEMVGGQQRMRIHAIIFGIGFHFTNKELISTKRTNQIDHLSRELPKKSFEFVIDNYNQDWTMDNPDSFAQVLEEQQIVQVTYGRKLDSGEIYKIPSMNLALKSWSSTHSTAKFTAVGFLDYSTTTYYDGRVEPKTLYDLAEEVLIDMGQTDYFIDPLLKKTVTNNPLQIDTHKACLQQIANAGRCVMYEDLDGHIIIKSSIIPDYVMTIENYESYSNIANVDNGEVVYNHATAEINYATADANFFEEIPVEKTGAVSYLYPTENELKVTIEFEAVWTFSGLAIRFGIIYPHSITIDEYQGDSLSESNDYDVDRTMYDLHHEFVNVDKLVITFHADDNTRVHLNKCMVGWITDYEITENDMAQLPTSTQTERVKSVNVKCYEFYKNEGNERKTSATCDADVGENFVTFRKPCYDYELSSGEIIDSGAYFVRFTSDVAEKVKLTATEYEKLERTYTMDIRRTGQELTVTNDLISDMETAEKVCKWFAEFYAGEVDYTINYRGEPALESGDRIYLENRFVDENLIVVTKEELSTSTGMAMNNTITARQVSYKRHGE